MSMPSELYDALRNVEDEMPWDAAEICSDVAWRLGWSLDQRNVWAEAVMFGESPAAEWAELLRSRLAALGACSGSEKP